MRYFLKKRSEIIELSIEESFTLLDFIALFACLLLGFFFAMFLWMFAAAIIVKVFTRHEFEFDADSYRLRQYLRIFGYLRIKRRDLSFDEIEKMLFSNFNSGSAMVEKGLIHKEWFTIEILKKDAQKLRIAKVDEDEIEDLNELFYELKERMGHWFTFEIEYEELGSI